mmetsp:Transcript_18643/g.28932  ORF Transcript_18643/g.28932 Transcript_18643/m.28932 type:complete len:469 (-) Transcript_18643:245-1651(-)|eukprot:CAMPEP_0196815324 /NCGR_PEP_ID=MMETSP1362-20130617/48999_1 /TAXON_ID=163516 /ORGANISM="Leptocylindrus danicus, Strain CCMP1856" /LENGTH=468 /DNA_ID=CAMNT_0042192235 /DNA_START=129 /DNA_END=1535 /DNA_ORIENTATION=-
MDQSTSGIDLDVRVLCSRANLVSRKIAHEKQIIASEEIQKTQRARLKKFNAHLLALSCFEQHLDDSQTKLREIDQEISYHQSRLQVKDIDSPAQESHDQDNSKSANFSHSSRGVSNPAPSLRKNAEKCKFSAMSPEKMISRKSDGEKAMTLTKPGADFVRSGGKQDSLPKIQTSDGDDDDENYSIEKRRKTCNDPVASSEVVSARESYADCSWDKKESLKLFSLVRSIPEMDTNYVDRNNFPDCKHKCLTVSDNGLSSRVELFELCLQKNQIDFVVFNPAEFSKIVRACDSESCSTNSTLSRSQSQLLRINKWPGMCFRQGVPFVNVENRIGRGSRKNEGKGLKRQFFAMALTAIDNCQAPYFEEVCLCANQISRRINKNGEIDTIQDLMVRQGIALPVDEDSQCNLAGCHQNFQFKGTDLAGNTNIIVIDDDSDDDGTNIPDLQPRKSAGGNAQPLSPEVIVIDQSD